MLFQQTVGMKMKLLQPDTDEVMAAMKRHQQQGVSITIILLYQ